MDFKFEINDDVRIVGYGHIIYMTSKENHNWGELVPMDIRPDLINKIGKVKERIITQGKPKYALSGLSKTAWYDEKQLEKVLSASEGKTDGSSSPLKEENG